MGTRIIFNGQEYTSPESMPPEVRQAYEQAMTHFADADGNGVPDVLERGAGDVIGVRHTSITINGRTFDGGGELPAPLRRIVEQAIGVGAPPPGRSPARDGAMAALDQADRTLETLLRTLLGLVAVATFVGAGFLMLVMDAGSRSQGGRLYVAVGAMLVLGAVDTQLTRLARRRWALFDWEARRRYRHRSLLLLAAAAAGLAALALLLP